MTIQQLAQQALTDMAPVILALFGYLGMVLMHTIQARVKNEYARGLLLRLDEGALTAVQSVEQTVVSKLTEGAGPLDPVQQKAALEAAKDQLRKYMGQNGIQELGKVLGITPAEVENVLTTHVESAVSVMPNSSASRASKLPSVPPKAS